VNKIGEQNTLNIQKPLSGKTTETPSTRSQRAAAQDIRVSREDEVDTDTQTRLHTLASTQVDHERLGRINQIRASIQAGEYRVNPPEVAAAILEATLQGY
jgi:anti-sigma28 factor (negative regulator of flagellin synthesis)